MSTRSDNPAAATRRVDSALLLLGQRHRSDLCAPRGRAEAQLAPTGADLEYPGAGAHPCDLQKAVDLAALRAGEVAEGGRHRLEQCAGVGHRLVEELGEQFVGQVVVLGDVAAGLIRAVVLGAGLTGQRDRTHPLQRPGHQIGHRRRERGQDPGEVIGHPLAGHVGLAEADQPMSPDPTGQPVGVAQHEGRQGRVGGADHRAVRIHQAQWQT